MVLKVSIYHLINNVVILNDGVFRIFEENIEAVDKIKTGLPTIRIAKKNGKVVKVRLKGYEVSGQEDKNEVHYNLIKVMDKVLDFEKVEKDGIVLDNCLAVGKVLS